MTIKTYPSHSWLKAANKHYENTLPYCANSLVANNLFFVGSGIGMTLATCLTGMISLSLIIAVLVGSITSVIGGVITGEIRALVGGVTVLGAVGIVLYKYDGETNVNEARDAPAESIIGVMKEGFLYGWDFIIGKSLYCTLDPAKYIIETAVHTFTGSTKAQDELAGEDAVSPENQDHETP